MIYISCLNIHISVYLIYKEILNQFTNFMIV